MSFARRSLTWNFLATTALTGKRSGRQNSSALPGSMAMLTPGVLAGLFCFGSPIAALAQDGQDGAAKDLPPIVVVDPDQKPKRVPAKRIAPAHIASSRGTSRTDRPAQEAAVTGAGAPTPAQAALDR